MGESVIAGQSVILTREVATAGSFTDEEVLEDLGRNALWLCRIWIRLLHISATLYLFISIS